MKLKWTPFLTRNTSRTINGPDFRIEREPTRDSSDRYGLYRDNKLFHHGTLTKCRRLAEKMADSISELIETESPERQPINIAGSKNAPLYPFNIHQERIVYKLAVLPDGTGDWSFVANDDELNNQDESDAGLFRLQDIQLVMQYIIDHVDMDCHFRVIPIRVESLRS